MGYLPSCTLQEEGGQFGPRGFPFGDRTFGPESFLLFFFQPADLKVECLHESFLVIRFAFLTGLDQLAFVGFLDHFCCDVFILRGQ